MVGVTPWLLPAAFPLVLAGSVVAILAFDVLAALFARGRPSFKYSRLWPLQFGVYVVIGFIAMLELLDVRLAGAVGAIAGLVEGTVGWAITWRLGPGRQPDAKPAAIAIASASMVAFGFGLAIAGALIFDIAILIVLRSHR